MVEIFKTEGTYQRRLETYEKDCWINIVSPTDEELRNLSQDLSIPIEFLTSPLDIDERPRVELEERNLFILIRTPHFDETNDIQYTAVPLGIVVNDNILITVSANKNDVIEAFVTGKTRGWSTAKRSQFILWIFSRTARVYLDYLRDINKQISIVEDKLEKSMKNEELIELLNLEKSLVYFTTSLRSNELVMERLQRTEMIKMYPDDRNLLEDVITENRQAIEMANIYSNILSALMDAFASVISNNLNVVMKFLTSVTVLLTIPIIISSIYGMNVKLPLQESPHAFAFTIGLSFVLFVMGLVIFVKRNWL